MANFQDHYSFSAFQKLIDINLEERKNEKKNYDVIFAENEIFYKAVVSFLKEKAKDGELEMPNFSKSHEAHFLTNWESLIENKLTHYQEETVGHYFRGVLDFTVIPFAYGEEPTENIEQHYQKLVEKINTGTFEKHDLSVEGECFNCGKRINVLGKNWKLALADIDYKNNKITPLKECIEDKLYEVKVEFKTGELLIADWFRIEEFTKKVEYNPDYTDVSINFALGRLKSTQHAAELGFVTVHVGNTCPHILQKDEDFIFGRFEYDPDEDEGPTQIADYQEKGMVCADLWNVTVIDKYRLIEIVSASTGMEKAEEIVEEYINENRSNMEIIHVQPGEYTITFDPKKELFSNTDKDELPSGIEAYLQMKKSAPKKKLKMN